MPDANARHYIPIRAFHPSIISSDRRAAHPVKELLKINLHPGDLSSRLSASGSLCFSLTTDDGQLTTVLVHPSRATVTNSLGARPPFVVHFRRKDEGELSSTMTATGYYPHLEVLRPVTGSRYLTDFPADGPIRPAKVPPNSFVKTNLPLSPLGRRICAPRSRKSVKNEDFTKDGGRGGAARYRT